MLHISARQTFERAPRGIRISRLIVFRYGLIGSLVLPPVLHHLLTTRLAKHLCRPTTIEQVPINPFSLSLSVRGLKVNELDSSILTLEPWHSILPKDGEAYAISEAGFPER